MTRRLTALTLGLALVVFGATAYMQGAAATITLKSGAQINGQLTDLGGVGFTIMVGGQDRNIPLADVAVIKFAGDGPVASMAQYNQAAQSGQHLFIMKSGDTIMGQLIDIGGAGPLRLTVRTGSGERDLNSNDVSQIVVGRPARVNAMPVLPPPPATTPPPAASLTGTTVSVAAGTDWTPTGITVKKGQVVRFQASGQIILNQGGDMQATPIGSTTGRVDKDAPLSAVPAGALIGRVGPPFSKPFVVGATPSATMPQDGMLWLGINDSNVKDNRGAFSVIINATGGVR